MLAQRACATDGTALARAGLQPQTLGGADPLPRRRAPAHRQQLGRNQIRPIALGRANWLFAGSLRAGQRAAAVMSLVQSARLNGLDPYAYVKDVLQRLPTHPARRVAELLPHRWSPTRNAAD